MNCMEPAADETAKKKNEPVRANHSLRDLKTRNEAYYSPLRNMAGRGNPKVLFTKGEKATMGNGELSTTTRLKNVPRIDCHSTSIGKGGEKPKRKDETAPEKGGDLLLKKSHG